MRIFSSADVQPPVNLIQLPLTIELPCETYSRVSLWKLLLSPFRGAYFEISRSGDSKIEQTPPIRVHIDAHIQNRALKVSLDIKNLIFGNFPNAKEGF